MEEKSYKSWYLPGTGAKLIPHSHYIDGLLAPAGEYKKPGLEKAHIFSLLAKFSAGSEKYFGPALALQTGNELLLPLQWRPIVAYLQRENIIENFYFDKIYHDQPILYQAYIIIKNHTIIAGSDGREPKNTRFAIGRSLNPEIAIAKGFGELLERFPLLVYKEKDFLRASLNDLAKTSRPFLELKKLAGFSDEQKAAKKNYFFDNSSQFLWTEAQSLFRPERILVPGQLIFWNFILAHRGWNEPTLRELNTNGAGGHYSLERAILSGIYELVQRDSFLIYWLNNQSPPRIEPDAIDNPQFKEFLAECSRFGYEIEFFDTTSDLRIPSCVCGVYDHSGIGPKLTFGGGCSFDWEKNLQESLYEAIGVYSWTRRRLKDVCRNLKFLPDDYADHRDGSIGQVDRINLWSAPEMFKNSEFFRRGKKVALSDLKKKSRQFTSPEKELNHLVNIFKQRGEEYEILYYQARHKVLDELGYCSVRVIIPPLVPLYLLEDRAVLGAKRLREVPKKLGFTAAKDLNYWPHPFP